MHSVYVDCDAPNWAFTTKWTINGAGYAKRSGGDFLHRLLLKDKLQPGLVVEHINGDKLDNRIENLRVVSQSENMLLGPSKIKRNNSSGVVGVTFHKQTNTWQPQVSIKRKFIWLGRYKTKEEATKVREEFMSCYRGYQNETAFSKSI